MNQTNQNWKNKDYIIKTSIWSIILIVSHFTFLINVQAFHRFHSSLARVDSNSKSGALEVTIQLFSHDVVEVFEKKYRKKIDLDETENIDGLLFEYIKQNFVLKTKDDETATIKWVGKESKVDWTWVYLEIPFSKDFEGATLQNTIFFESYDEQTNYVILRFGQKKADLFFKVGDKVKEIRTSENTKTLD